MKTYRSISGAAGVVAYEIGTDSITIRFQNGSRYLYNYASTGKRAVEIMKKLAAKGSGLSTYISQNAKSRYAAKLE